jgi:hypothetical protein
MLDLRTAILTARNPPCPPLPASGAHHVCARLFPPPRPVMCRFALPAVLHTLVHFLCVRFMFPSRASASFMPVAPHLELHVDCAASLLVFTHVLTLLGIANDITHPGFSFPFPSFSLPRRASPASATTSSVLPCSASTHIWPASAANQCQPHPPL